MKAILLLLSLVSYDAMLIDMVTTGPPELLSPAGGGNVGWSACRHSDLVDQNFYCLQAAAMLVGRCDVILTKPGQTEFVRLTLVMTI